MLPPPHGHRLINRVLSTGERERWSRDAGALPRVRPFVDQVFDAEKIATGAYSPLEGFQGQEEVDTILRTGRLPSELPWPIPIVLAPSGPANEEVVATLRTGDDVALEDRPGHTFAILHLEEKFPTDRRRLAREVYGTVDPAHPNVADLFASGETALAGPIDLLDRLTLPTGDLELTPAETRAEFDRRGWKNVAGYQTRNVPHTAHEYLQRCALEREDVDGLLIHPVLGRLKKGDYRPEVILEAYRALVRNYYPQDRVLLAALSITMRYAGPKAALFLAIVRKNFGCNSYIVGRDQAGVGNYYDPFACHRIFDEFEIGLTPIRFAEMFFCRDCRGMASGRTCAHPPDRRIDTSQTRIRRALAQHEPLPPELLRPEVLDVLARGDLLLPS
jgi:sulfate adenylyltransferase